MSVRPILLQKDGAIKGIPGAYRTSPPPIAGPYAGSDLLEDVTYYTVNSSGEAELKTVKAYPFYVDSISGGADTSGDGTIANPWRSVNRALSVLQPILTCLNSKSCCTYLVLRVKGEVDYTVQYNNGSAFNGYNRFIIGPWEDSPIIINVDGFVSSQIIRYIHGTIFKNISIMGNSQKKPFYCIYDCHYSVFNNINIEMNIFKDVLSDPCAFTECDYSIFYECNIEMNIINSIGGGVEGIFSCDYSIFYKTTCSINQSSYKDEKYIVMFCFMSNTNSSFFSCDGNIYTSDAGAGCGFFSNTNSIFLNCTGNSITFTNCNI